MFPHFLSLVLLFCVFGTYVGVTSLRALFLLLMLLDGEFVVLMAFFRRPGAVKCFNEQIFQIYFEHICQFGLVNHEFIGVGIYSRKGSG